MLSTFDRALCWLCFFNGLPLQHIEHFLRLSRRAHSLSTHLSSNVFLFVLRLVIAHHQKRLKNSNIIDVAGIQVFSFSIAQSLRPMEDFSTQFANKSYQHASLLGYLS